MLLLLSMMSCSSQPTFLPEVATLNLAPIHALVASGQEHAALEELNELRWPLSGSLEAERLRQDLRLRNGGLVAILNEISKWQRKWPQNPDLMYLSTRVLEDPMLRRERFHDLLRSYPTHPWIRFGAIATAQQMGDWRQAERWLKIPMPSTLPVVYQHILHARQLAQQNEFEAALLLLEADAFPHGLQISLTEYLALATKAKDRARQARATSELAIRRVQAVDLTQAQAIDLAFARLLGEWPWLRMEKFSIILERLDAWLIQTGAPSGWAGQEEYSVAGVAKLLRPESTSGQVSKQWAQAGRVLLAGSAWGRGHEFHLLQGTKTMALTWPGHAQDVELIFAQGVTSTHGQTAQGGTVFRGFYVLQDSVRLGTIRLQRRLDRFQPPQNLSPGKGRLESLELAQRLRSRLLTETSFQVEELEILHLCLHESGHFTEILNWLDFGLPVAELLPAMLASRQRYGNPILWLEYRAQLRALTSGRIPTWLFAEILERGQDPRDPYFLPYRHILMDLVDLAEEQGWPHLSQWHTKAPEDLTQLAMDLCTKKQIEPMPLDGAENIVQVLIQADLLQMAPPNRAVSD